VTVSVFSGRQRIARLVIFLLIYLLTFPPSPQLRKAGKSPLPGWQVGLTLCDPIWNVISRSSVVISMNCNKFTQAVVSCAINVAIYFIAAFILFYCT